ncbi:MAG: hypothetical protein H7289_09685, partial [Mucilaginibacter sp.]|nr:hypothetical protein [Mucilaginibacter sp.]
MANLKQIKHLTSRAGFGMGFDELNAAETITVKQAIKDLFKASDDYQPLEIVKGS